jgi:hypothetical protein
VLNVAEKNLKNCTKEMLPEFQNKEQDTINIFENTLTKLKNLWRPYLLERYCPPKTGT